MIGLLTKIKEAKSPFQRDISPYEAIKSFPARKMETLLSACFVFKTQNGLVAIADMHPANPEHFEMLRNEFGLKPNNFLA